MVYLFPLWRKRLCFCWLGAVLSIILSIILAGVTFCRSFADYWAYIIVQFFPLYGEKEPEPEPEQTKTNVWDRHIARMDALQQEEENKKN